MPDQSDMPPQLYAAAKPGSTGRNAGPGLVALALVVCAVLASGCTRAHYRILADREVEYLVKQKADELSWTLPPFPTYNDPRSRYTDPTSPDAPAMPFDDPVAHRYMHCVNCMRGWPCWHIYGDWGGLENPEWRAKMQEYAEFTKEGALKLSAESAVRVGIINSSDYRTQLDTLYLSAIDVSTERFRFVTQFYGTADTNFVHQGALAAGNGTGMERNTLTTDTLNNANIANTGNVTQVTDSGSTNAFLQKEFATGAELMVGVANSFVWQFAGPDSNNARSILNFSLIQPLLRFGGRVFALERLTIAERNLLSNLRAFQRYREGFYTNVVIGDNNGVTGPQREGGFSGGTGLSGFSGTGTGGFGTLGQITNFGGRTTGGQAGFGAAGGGTAGFAGGSAGLVNGFIGLVQQLQQIRNTQASLNSQVRTLGLLEANLAAGIIDIAQVDVFRQNIETERANLLAAQVTLANTLDNFKVTVIGLPPNLPIELDDSIIEQFRLVDPRTTAVQDRIDDFIDILGDMPKTPSDENLRKALDVVDRLSGMVAGRFEAAKKDTEKLDAATPTRLKSLDAKHRKVFEQDKQRLEDSLSELYRRFQKTETELQQARTAPIGSPERMANELVDLSSTLSGMTQELSLVQARSRLESVTIDPITLDPKRGIDIARANRLDWMNNRVVLVDTWRLIAFNANALKSGLNLRFSGEVDTKNNNPLNFNGNTGTLAVGVQFDAPFTRRLERNNFRQSLISYQQGRRQLIIFQDGVYQRLRNYLRTLRQLQVLLEIQRRAVVIAVRRVDQTREILNQPPAPVEPGETPSQLGPTSAQNLLTALSDLRNAQNNFMSVWLNHYETRMLLMRELGIMEIDENGQWVDRPLDEAQWLDDELCPLPPPVPNHWLREVDIESEAEAEELAPGSGSRRSDVRDVMPPSLETIFPDPPNAENRSPLQRPSDASEVPNAEPEDPVPTGNPNGVVPLNPDEPEARRKQPVRVSRLPARWGGNGASAHGGGMPMGLPGGAVSSGAMPGLTNIPEVQEGPALSR